MLKVKFVYMVCFVIAFTVRLFLIVETPQNNNFIDVQINRDMGQLITHGINPYNVNDKPELRDQLRTDTDNYNSYLSESQERWNFYSSSNLPLNVLFLGGVEYLFPSYTAHRSVIAFFDSILSCFILAFVLRWQISIGDLRYFRKHNHIVQKYFPLLLGLFLGAMSPVLLHWGTVFTETKGIELLLMLSAVFYSYSSDKRLSMLVSPILLGFSASFMALGIFIAPLCLYNVYHNNANSIRKAVSYFLISFASAIIWLILFMPELFSMIAGRMGVATSVTPMYGSMWKIIYEIFPDAWMVIQRSFILLFTVLIAIGIYRKRLSVALVSAAVLHLFTNVYLVNGSMDRMNIALLTVIILLGCCSFFQFASLLSLLYIVYGSFILAYFFIRHRYIEDRDGLFVLIFTGFFLIFLITQIFGKGPLIKERENIH